MHIKKKSFWITLSLVNLCIVALLGFTLRTKFLFSIPFIDYRNFLSAHSHFAFGGWVGLVLTTLLIFQLLPPEIHREKIYTWILAFLEISSVGMVISFPFQGYGAAALFFSTLYILTTYVFGFVFIKDIRRTANTRIIKMLSLSGVTSLLLSSIGPAILAYIMITHSGDSNLYRDAVYTFLHFQYNCFFTLSVFALFFSYLQQKGLSAEPHGQKFALFISLSVLPALFLSLLWHNSTFYYVLAAIGCVLILAALFFFIRLGMATNMRVLFSIPLAHALCTMAFLSFGLKMFLNVGTIIPQLGNAVYGDRPVIIGFLHLVFLAFVTFFIHARLIEAGYFHRKGKVMRFPFFVFAFGVISSEILLGVQGLEILFKSNNYLYNWLIWGSSIVLFLGGFMIMIAHFMADDNKKVTGKPVTFANESY